MSRFEADLMNTDDQRKTADVAEALALGVSRTPVFFINAGSSTMLSRSSRSRE
jgi:hypothetical protein